MLIEELRNIERPAFQEAFGWIGRRVEDIRGASIGTLEDVWLDPQNGEPRWLLVRSGRFGGRHTLIPFADAIAGTGHVWVLYEHETVRRAPTVSPTMVLSPDLDIRLQSHYEAARGRPSPQLPSSPRRRPEHAHRLGR